MLASVGETFFEVNLTCQTLNKYTLIQGENLIKLFIRGKVKFLGCASQILAVSTGY